LVEVTPWNLVEQSETIGTSPWSNINSGITSNATTAPNGTTTAEKLMVTTANTPHQVQQSFNNDNANHTVFIYAKKSELNFIQLALGNSTEQYANFNLNTGVVGTKGSYCASSSMESVGDGWYKCIAYFNQGTIPSLMIYVTNSASSDWGGVVSYSGANNTDGIFVWGYQLNIGSTAKPYFPTTDRLNVPRLTYQNGGGGCPSLLLEKQSTNLELWSQDLTNAVYVRGGGGGGTVTKTANYGISPDGTQNATRLQIVRGSSYAELYQRVATTIGVTYTFSFWGKSLSGTPTLNTVWNGGYENEITFTTDWVRYTYTFVASDTLSGINLITWTSLPNTSTTADILVWGVQLEQSSYPTSYIPTTSASATRVLDECTKTGINSLIGQQQGTLFFDLNPSDFFDPSYVGINGVTRFIVGFEGDSGNTGTLRTYGIWNTSLGTFSRYQRLKIAMAYKNNDLAIYINGALVTSSTSVTFTGDFSVFSFANNVGSQYFKGNINQAAIFKTRLTNAELASLTTI